MLFIIKNILKETILLVENELEEFYWVLLTVHFYAIKEHI